MPSRGLRVLGRRGGHQAHTKTVVATAWTADEAHLLSAGYPEDIFGWAPVKPAAAMP